MPVKRDDIMTALLPQHIAIIMDGNGRWAKARRLPRIAGHRAGVKAVRRTVEYCAKQGVQVLTLFAFSSENWGRPEEEINFLMSLFLTTLQKETQSLHENNVRMRFIGDDERFPSTLRQAIVNAVKLTENNSGLTLVIAVNYSGRWDLTQAMRQLALEVQAGVTQPNDISTTRIQQALTLADLPEPDLFIRTSGELRLSNFLLWHLAYTELYFTDTYWPDFNEADLDKALSAFSQRRRRFGLIEEQHADA